MQPKKIEEEQKVTATSPGYRSTVLHNLKVYLSKYDEISDVNTYDVFKLENNFKLNKTETEKKLVEMFEVKNLKLLPFILK